LRFDHPPQINWRGSCYYLDGFRKGAVVAHRERISGYLCSPKAAMRNPSFGVRECAELRGNTRMSFSYSTRAESKVCMSTRWTRPTIATICVCGCATAPFLALQSIRPRLENPSVTAEIQAPSAVRDILKHSCYNCHSNETDLEWFDKIAPMSWLVLADTFGRPQL
jgi:Haem-binding domain